MESTKHHKAICNTWCFWSTKVNGSILTNFSILSFKSRLDVNLFVHIKHLGRSLCNVERLKHPRHTDRRALSLDRLLFAAQAVSMPARGRGFAPLPSLQRPWVI